MAWMDGLQSDLSHHHRVEYASPTFGQPSTAAVADVCSSPSIQEFRNSGVQKWSLRSLGRSTRVDTENTSKKTYLGSPRNPRRYTWLIEEELTRSIASSPSIYRPMRPELRNASVTACQWIFSVAS